jgi:hypothetical protein
MNLKIYSISSWYGGLGNNIQQVANGLLMAEFNKACFQQKLTHPLIGQFKFNFSSSRAHLFKSNTREPGIFFQWEGIIDCPSGSLTGHNQTLLDRTTIYQNIGRICHDYIYPNLKLPKVLPIEKSTLVIHIRSGDIFAKEFKDPTNYVPNPLDFYRRIMRGFKNSIIVSEPDSYNPIVQELANHKNVRLVSKNTSYDFATLLSAANLATSGVGTFGIAAALLSQNIENLYVTNLHLTEHLNYQMITGRGINLNVSVLPNYIPVSPCSWRNDEAQRQFIMNYRLPTA